ncbi:hypothetical protein SLE2022_258430 [Rubroshorea leprosula]
MVLNKIMELVEGKHIEDGEMEELEISPGSSTPPSAARHVGTRFPGMVRQKAYTFDGLGKYYPKEWDLVEGRVPRLGFSPVGESLLSEIPSVESPSYFSGHRKESSGIVIREHVLEFLLTMNHSEEADNPVPHTVSNLVVHIIDSHVDQLQDVVTNLEMELDSVELQLDKGGFTLKKQMLDDRRFPKMHLNLQRLLQVIAHGEAVFPRVKEKCSSKHWFASEDISALEELIGCLRRLKENVGFLANRVTAIQAGLDSWQAEQINRKLYYLSILSIIFLPLSIITGVFGMNVGGVPWTGQNDPKLQDGFRNKSRSIKRSWSLNRSFIRRTLNCPEREGYLRI